MAKRAIVVLAEGFEETEAVATIDVLRRGGIEVTVAGLRDRQVRGTHAITVGADRLLSDLDDSFDAIVLPGGMPGTTHLADSALLHERIVRFFGAGKLCAAVCAAPSVLGRAGILVGKKATCYPGFETQLGGATFVDAPVVRDGNVITSRGVGTVLDFALAVVEYLGDRVHADGVADKILHRRR